MSGTFGKVNEVSICQVINNSDFNKYWSINKNEIETCKDCEFRFCCTDCRVFIDDKSNLNSRPSKCKYNPYQGLWEGEEGYISVEKWKIKEKK